MADSFVDAVNSKATGGNAIVPEAMDLLKTFESFKPTSYYDLDNKKKRGTLTVGYGFTKNDIPEIREGYSIDKGTADRMLPDLVKTKYGATVREKVKVPLNDQQYSALTSFAYNVGPTNFSNSTLLKKLNAGDYNGAADQFKVWNKAGGQTMEGLNRRRAAEEALFKGDTMTLGSILEKQKFGGNEPKKKGGLSDTGETFLDAVGGIDLAKAVSAPIGEGGSPDNPPVPATSEALTPLPDSPEDTGKKAAEKIAKDFNEGKGAPAPATQPEKPTDPNSPEGKGKAAAEKILLDFESKKANQETPKKEKSATDIAKEMFMEGAEEKEKDKEKKEDKKLTLAEQAMAKIQGIQFSGANLDSAVSGLKRNAGLGRMK
jgi:GH24 family phage-related lysozyme (muramidase)